MSTGDASTKSVANRVATNTSRGRAVVIRSVEATSFGGLRGSRLEIPDSRFVVVQGSNETGKTTYSELIAWLLVGASNRSKPVGRFGNTGDKLSGELSGRIDSDEFSVRGEFVLSTKGVSSAKSSRLVTFGLASEELTQDRWSEMLGGVDHEVLSSIYRLWGQELHEGGDVVGHLSKVVLGAFGSGLDPFEVVERLRESARKMASSKAENTASVLRLTGEIDGLDGAIGSAAANVDQYEKKLSELAELQTLRGDEIDELQGLHATKTRFGDAKKVLEQRGLLEEAKSDLAEIDELPPGWHHLVADMPTLTGSVDKLKNAQSAATAADAELDQALSELDPANPEAARRRVSGLILKHSGQESIVAAVTRIDSAIDQVAGFADDLAVSRIEEAEQMQSFLVACDIAGTDRAKLSAARLDQMSLANVGEAVGRCEGASEEIITTRSAMEKLTIEVDEALRDAGDCEARWASHGLGVTPGEYLANPGLPTSDRQGIGVWWLPPAMVLLLAIAAVVMASWEVGVGAALVSIAVYFLLRPRAAVAPLDSGKIGSGLIDDARNVLQSMQAIDEARSRQTSSELALLQSEQELVERVEALPQRGQSIGVDLPADHTRVRTILARWSKAHQLLLAIEVSEQKVRKLEGSVQAAQSKEALVRRELADLLEAAGLPGDLSPESAPTVARQHRSAAEKMSRLGMLIGAAERAREDLAIVIEPLGSVASEKSLGWITDTADSMAKLAEERETAESDVRTIENMILALLADDQVLESLVDELVDPSDLEERIIVVDSEISDAEARREEIVQAAAGVKAEISRLESESEIADLRVARGSLEERRADLAFESAARTLAAVLAEEVAAKRQRENQPQLIRSTSEMACRVATDWSEVTMKPATGDSSPMWVRLSDGVSIPVDMLSTGSKALLYLSLRIAMADHDAEPRGVEMPLLCDDPLIHVDDDRARSAVGVLAEASRRRQVVLFTCHQRTVDAMSDAGAAVVEM